MHLTHLLVCGLGVVDLHLAVGGGERDAIGDDLVDLLLDVGRRGVALLLGRGHLQAVDEVEDDDDEVQNFVVVDSSRISICHIKVTNFLGLDISKSFLFSLIT